MEQGNPIYSFMKDNGLTSKDEATFVKEYSTPEKARELHAFMQGNDLTKKDFDSFYSEYFAPKGAASEGQPATSGSASSGLPSLSGASKEYQDKLLKMNFVQRMYDPNKFIQNKDGSKSTHKMTSAEVDGKNIAFPTIVEKAGKLYELGVDDAIDHAMKTGEYAEFANEKDAQSWAEGGYKKGTPLENFENDKPKAKFTIGTSEQIPQGVQEKVKKQISTSKQQEEPFVLEDLRAVETELPSESTSVNIPKPQIKEAEKAAVKPIPLEQVGKVGERVDVEDNRLEVLDYNKFSGKRAENIDIYGLQKTFEQYKGQPMVSEGALKAEKDLKDAYLAIEEDYLDVLKGKNENNYLNQKNKLEQIREKQRKGESLDKGDEEFLYSFRNNAIDLAYKAQKQKAYDISNNPNVQDYRNKIEKVLAKKELLIKEYNDIASAVGNNAPTQEQARRLSEIKSTFEGLNASEKQIEAETGVTENDINTLKNAYSQMSGLNESMRKNADRFPAIQLRQEQKESIQKQRAKNVESGNPFSLLDEFVRSYVGAVGSAVTNIGKLPKIAYDFGGDTEYDWTDKVFDYISDLQSEKEEQFGRVEKFDELPMYAKIPAYLGEAVGSISTLAAGGVLSSGSTAALMGTSFITSEANYYEEALRNGLSPTEAARQSSIVAGVSSAIEGVVKDVEFFNPRQFEKSVISAYKSGKTFKESVKGALENVIPSARQYAEKMSTAGAQEAGEETFQQFGEDVTKEAINTAKGREIYKDTFEPSTYAEAAAIGGLGGTAVTFSTQIGRRRSPVQESLISEVAKNPNIVSDLAEVNPQAAKSISGLVDELSKIRESWEKIPSFQKLDDNVKNHIISEALRVKQLTKTAKDAMADPRVIASEVNDAKSNILYAQNNNKIKGDKSETAPVSDLKKEAASTTGEAVKQGEDITKNRDLDLFPEVNEFSSIVGDSKSNSKISNYKEINGIGFSEYSNSETGDLDLVVTGTSDHDFVGFIRIYENGKPTNRWTSKFENQSGNKENFKTMISEAQKMLPKGHEYTEKTSISTDGLRVFAQQLNKGYELQYDDNGNVITNAVAINGDSKVNDLGINVTPGDFSNISVTNDADFEKVKKALKPYLENLGLSEKDIFWRSGTVKINLPVLKQKADDSQNEQGVPSEVGGGQAAVETQPIEGTGAAQVGPSGNVQALEEEVIPPKATEAPMAAEQEVVEEAPQITPEEEAAGEQEFAAAVENVKAIEPALTEDEADHAAALVQSGESVEEAVKHVKEVAEFENEITGEIEDEPVKEQVRRIASEYLDAMRQSKYTPKQQAIVDVGVSTTRKSFERFGDKNFITQNISRSYFNKNGVGIDEIALYASNETGLDITPDDVVEFMLEYPNGLKSRSARATQLANEYKKLTGKNITTRVAESILAKQNKENASLNNSMDAIYRDIENAGIVDENGNLSEEKLLEVIDDEGFFTVFPLGLTKEQYEKLKQHVKGADAEAKGPSVSEPNGKAETATEPTEEVVAETKASKASVKKQIENFGVAKDQVEPVNKVISKVFEGLKKAGLTAAKTVEEWVGIGKYRTKDNQSLFYNENEIKNKSLNINDNEKLLNRLSQEEELGRSNSGSTNARATIIAERVHKSNEGNGNKKIKQQEENELKKDAKENGYWIDSSIFKDPHTNGAESDVFVSEDGKTVIKIKSNDIHYENWLNFLDSIALHNTLEPNAKYILKGFTEYNGEFRAIIEQPFIKDAQEATKQEIFDDMRQKGYESKGLGVYVNKNTGVIVSDLITGNGNALKSNGHIFYIDPVIKPHTIESGFNGKRKIEYSEQSKSDFLFKNEEAQYRIESGKNIVEAIENFNGSPRAVVALTHEIMHPTVVAIIDGAKEGNEVGARHTKTIVDEFNKANPNNTITAEELIAGNDSFKEGTTTKQYRDVQEFIAESWEKYHTEGPRGFSAAFQKVLQQITDAFRSVYGSISNQQISPELREMFDEILGKKPSATEAKTETKAKAEPTAKEAATEIFEAIDNESTDPREKAAQRRENKAKFGAEEYAKAVKVTKNFDKIIQSLEKAGEITKKC